MNRKLTFLALVILASTTASSISIIEVGRIALNTLPTLGDIDISPYDLITSGNLTASYINLTSGIIGDVTTSGQWIFNGVVFFRDNVTVSTPLSLFVNETLSIQSLTGHTEIFFNATGDSWFNVSGGKVGIGTASPNEALTVVGNASFVGNNNFEFLTISETFDSFVGLTAEGISIKKEGNNIGGLGRILNHPAYGNITGFLFKKENAEGNAGVVVFDESNEDLAGFTSWHGIYLGDTDADVVGGLNISIFRGTTSPIFNIEGATGNLVTLGKVGIGTTAPSARLDISGNDSRGYSLNVSGDLYVNATSGRVGIGTSSPNDALHIDSGNTRNVIRFTGGDNKELFVGQPSNDVGYLWYQGNTLQFATENAESMRLYKGDLGIGTPYPGHKTVINGSLRVQNSTNATLFFVNAGNGRVGIGTASPDTNLEIVAGTADGIIVERLGTDRIKILGDGTMFWGSAADSGRLSWDTGKAIVQGLTGYDLSFGANWAADQLYIKTGGNVGIGTTDPTSKLHVVGSVNITDKLSANLSHVFGLATAVHTVAVADTWYNITMNRTFADVVGFTLSTDNVTIIIPNDAHYTITFGMGIMDSDNSPSAHVAMRVEVNDVELRGSYIEYDTHRQATDYWLEHTTHVDLSEGDEVILQYISSATTVTISQEDTYAAQGFSAFGYIQEVIG